MCGIAGQLGGPSGPDPVLVAAMAARLAHRGPDECGAFSDAHCALAVRRLAVQDTGDGRQPAYSEDGTVVAVLNGEIYNFAELRARLERAGHRMASRSDTEVLPHLYEEHGDKFVDYLYGMFAVAVWDGRRRWLVLARDRLGQKPLLYSEHGSTFRFGSEAKAFFADPAFPREPDFAALHVFLSLGAVAAPATGFRHLNALLPGHRLIVADGRVTAERYWSLYPAQQRITDPREAAELVRESLRTAVVRRMAADVPLGAFLSGGVDSACVVALMAQESSKPVRTFTIGVAGHGYDERAAARRVAQEFGTEHTERVVSGDVMALLPQLAWYYDQPFADSSMLPTYQLARQARSQVVVALNGDGGDEAFLGYTRTLRIAGWQSARRSGGISEPVPLPPDNSSMGVGRLPARRLAALRRSADPLGVYCAWLLNFDETALRAAYRPDFERAVAGTSAVSLIRAAADVPGDDSHRLQAADYGVYLPAVLLPKVDVATMAASLEARSPYLDHELVQLAVSLPARLSLAADGGKAVLRDAFRGVVPDANLDGPKRGFGVPLHDWFRSTLADVARALLDSRSARLSEYLIPGAVRALLDAHAAGRAWHGNRLYSLICLELWLRTYISSPPAPHPPSDLTLYDIV